MIAFDASFLIDYLDGVEATREVIESYDGKPFFAPSLALFETYRGAARTDGPAGVERVVAALDWLDPLPLTDGAAEEAALVEAELLNDGEPINLGDVLVAGICRHHGATLVTRDAHFESVDGIEVRSY
ncbi:PIN domain-containing protein [Halorientalis pallida]|uniref:PIN domain-containing protein n=1 Tax=Halorientalis pallida TaxID=2479928 RepID=UPI003C6EE9DA